MVKVCVLGYGTVGTGLVELIDKNNRYNGTEIEIAHILVKNRCKHEKKKFYDLVVEELKDEYIKESDIVIELMGGIEPAYEYIRKALNHKKHVITANKDLIAEYGKELFNLAENTGVSIKFEAAVAGAIPVIKALIESLKGNEINNIRAILNGTTNFILTQMDLKGLSYDEALKEAQRLGFAEANPEADVKGYDSARKLALLSTIAFKNRVDWRNIEIQGITKLDRYDFELARKLNCRIKLLAYSKKKEDRVYAIVAPVFVSNSSKLYSIDNETNSVIVEGDAVGEMVLVGKGAGMLPTASAVFGDLMDTVENRVYNIATLFNNKISLQNNHEEAWEGILRLVSHRKDEVLRFLSKSKLSFNILNEGDALALRVKTSSQEELEKVIEYLLSLPYILDVKKFEKVG
ncbi:homoserine dehydrogenase [Desnuesiella massiliensis]|uniref:homoserine dehydrogenase n=1 Tax=Desnuesiella massiliensis TaxID=1650662 RepID=UPI0006E2A512|nr:homoserine dehydrogenase [Desnuesiella massiliensis]